ncbi:DUF1707 SHOCT-like domain-containing protein [Streptoalloteichus tenebrarius]|uniref:DUF1707 SHOCT-like domain-containing protein n=1 Tax=Streptoalloteichus tenebrarius (strain ATCC 17920 / DSM 40477 / JCM 4838 / CBS 697.72 / NBRC 16177 / NCIMB 11028 / NRRL B-12390 / A12253. 1 / ISP 5477) TaxID=1933 RepID=UPI0020A2D353|nr:DUF1707 domain-containing protein [Streptoalloteichus tenebrarius]
MDDSGRTPDIRIGDAERERAVSALSEHLTAGRLEIAEYDERCARAMAARYRGELAALFADLPEPRPMAPPALVSPPPPAPPTPRRGGRSSAIVALAAVAGLALVLRQWALFAPLAVVVIILVIRAGRRSG